MVSNDSGFTTVSSGAAEAQVPETKIVFEEINDEFTGFFLGYRELRDRITQQPYTQARFKDPETDEICYTRANNSMKEGLDKVNIGELTRITYTDDVDTGMPSPMRSFTVEVNRSRTLVGNVSGTSDGSRPVRRAQAKKPAGKPVKDAPQA